jgi:steroid 5-alpha reductase family enzyme
LILFVSGIPLTEKHFAGRAGWSEYVRRTSKFLPLPPKKS